MSDDVSSPTPAVRAPGWKVGSRRRRATERGSVIFSASFLPIIMVFLGGGTTPWAQALFLFLVGEMILFLPPEGGLGRILNGVFLGLAVLPVFTFLPAAWFEELEWRVVLTQDLGIPLAFPLTPQPWLTLEAWLVYLGGLGWIYWMLATRWNGGERAAVARWLSIGIVLIAALSLSFRATGWHPEFWESEKFGPFPNRNQSGNFFALGALLILARAHLDFRRRTRPWAGLSWIAGWAVVAAAVFASYSRAGVLLLFGGAAAYLGGVAWLGARQSRHLESEDDDEAPPEDDTADEGAQRRERTSRTLALGASLLLLLACTFFVFGGETLQRFRVERDAGAARAIDPAFRFALQADALDLAAASAWPGIGLGNMGDLLGLYRTRTMIPARAIHPESDWVWLRVELGWLGLLLALVGVLLVVQRILPLRRGGVEPIRLAGLLALGAFVLHGVFDVSGHRLGTLLTAAVVAGLAVPRLPRGGRPALLGFRIGGAALGVVGFIALGAAWQRADFPGSIGVSNDKSLAYESAARGEVSVAQRQVTEALRWAPLDYHSYLVRAELGVAARMALPEVEDDFARARTLEPRSVVPPYREAIQWMKWRPENAVNALAEACRRDPGGADKMIARVVEMGAGPDAAIFRERLRAWVRGDAQRLSLFLTHARPEEVREEIQLLLERDPGLKSCTAVQLPRILQAWAVVGDAPSLLRAFGENPEWQRAAWQSWAIAFSRTGDVERASEIAGRYAPAPALPGTSGEDSIAALERDFQRHPEDVAKAYDLFQALTKAGRAAEALATITRVTAQPRVPGYLHYLEAGARMKRGEYAAAWDAWQRYFQTLRANG